MTPVPSILRSEMTPVPSILRSEMTPVPSILRCEMTPVPSILRNEMTRVIPVRSEMTHGSFCKAGGGEGGIISLHYTGWPRKLAKHR